jgi:hypothetical protein
MQAQAGRGFLTRACVCMCENEIALPAHLCTLDPGCCALDWHGSSSGRLTCVDTQLGRAGTCARRRRARRRCAVVAAQRAGACLLGSAKNNQILWLVGDGDVLRVSCQLGPLARIAETVSRQAASVPLAAEHGVCVVCARAVCALYMLVGACVHGGVVVRSFKAARELCRAPSCGGMAAVRPG